MTTDAPAALPLLQLFDDASSTWTYVAYDPASREAVIVDPVLEQQERDVAALAAHGLTLRWAIETHAHADHVTASGVLARRLGAATAAPALCGIAPADRQLQHGDALPFGSQALTALHTPGHTAGSMCYLWPRPRPEPDAVFTGDTLLIGGCGRTDFQSGSAAALYDSITTRLFTLPAQTLVFPGHDYQGRRSSTIGAEQATNPRLAGRTRDEFIALMATLQLAPPRLIDVAVPANRRLGLAEPAAQPQDAAEGGERPRPGGPGPDPR
jgi:sulfur dioxygenase